MEKLAIVMPVYNEEGSIGLVLDKWVKTMDGLGISYTIFPYNDGSKDGSWKVMQAKAEQYPGKIVPHIKENSGHGPTILQGYKNAADQGYSWVFQLDSDDEMGPDSFHLLWENRYSYDFLAGTREGRKQDWSRKIVSFVSRFCVRLFYEKSIWDVNTPYRLMRVSSFKQIWESIPPDCFAPNVIISGLAGYEEMRCYEISVPQENRKTGEVSIKKWGLIKAALKSFYQTILFSVKNGNFFYPVSILLSLFLFSLTITFSPFASKRYGAVDSDVFLLIGQSLRNGFVPYKDIFDHKGPLIYFINAAGDWLGGFKGIGIIEIFFWFLFLFILCRIWKLLRLDVLAFGLVAIMLPLICRPILCGGNLTEEYAIPFIAFGNLYLLKLCLGRDIKKIDSFLLGIFAASTLTLKPNMTAIFIVDLLALLYFLLMREKKLTSFFQSVIFGGLGVVSVLLPLFLFFYFSNALKEMFFCSWNFNLIYSSHTESLCTVVARMIDRTLSVNYLFLPLLFSFMLLFSKKKEEGLASYLFLILNVVFSVFTCIFARSFYEHYLLIMIPVYALLFGIICSKIKLNLKKTGYLLFFFGLFLFNLHTLSRWLLKDLVKPQENKALQEMVHFLSSRKPFPKNTTIILGNNCSLYETLKLEPHFKYVYQDPIIRVSPSIRKDIFQSISQQEYFFIVDPISDGWLCGKDTSDHVVQELYKVIFRFYYPVFSNGKYRVYKRKERFPGSED